MAMRAVPFLSTPFPVQKPRPFYPRTGLSHFFKYREGNSIASKLYFKLRKAPFILSTNGAFLHFFKYLTGNRTASMSMTFWKFPSGSSVRSHSARTASSRMGRACPAMPTKSRAWMSQICQICMDCRLSGRSSVSDEVQAPQGGSSPSSAHVSRHSSQLMASRRGILRHHAMIGG